MGKVMQNKKKLVNSGVQREKSVNTYVSNKFSEFFGINDARSKYLLGLVGISKNLKLSYLNKYYFELLRNVLLQLYVVDDKLMFLNKRQKINYMNIRHYRGIRYSVGLPVRGQRTKTNSRTARKFVISKVEVAALMKKEEEDKSVTKNTTYSKKRTTFLKKDDLDFF